VESRFKDAGIEGTYQSLNGVVETAIADYVEDSAIDLLVLGAYGHSRIRELLIGSTTTELLRSCHVPVFCFR
jgi:nucleotide-binding universal stress UspA family protein